MLGLNLRSERKKASLNYILIFECFRLIFKGNKDVMKAELAL